MWGWGGGSAGGLLACKDKGQMFGGREVCMQSCPWSPFNESLSMEVREYPCIVVYVAICLSLQPCNTSHTQSRPRNPPNHDFAIRRYTRRPPPPSNALRRPPPTHRFNMDSARVRIHACDHSIARTSFTFPAIQASTCTTHCTTSSWRPRRSTSRRTLDALDALDTNHYAKRFINAQQAFEVQINPSWPLWPP